MPGDVRVADGEGVGEGERPAGCHWLRHANGRVELDGDRRVEGHAAGRYEAADQAAVRESSEGHRSIGVILDPVLAAFARVIHPSGRQAIVGDSPDGLLTDDSGGL